MLHFSQNHTIYQTDLTQIFFVLYLGIFHSLVTKKQPIVTQCSVGILVFL